ncbi:MAG: alpha/beta hydrolase [Phycisphaeraceae bacterium]
MGLLVLLLVAVVLLWLIGAVALVYALGHPPRKTFAVALAQGDPTEPADLELDAEAVTFSLSDGSRSPGWVIKGSATDGPTVVILHGYGDSRYGSLLRVPLVQPFSRKVVVFDLPGQGESESKRGYGGLREPRDVLAVLSQLEPGDAERIVLLGASMGAGVAIAAAAEAAGELRRAIIGVIAESPYRFWDEPLHNLFRFRRYPRRPIIPLAGLWFRLTAKGFREFDRAGYAGRLNCPLLVLHGSEDRLCPVTSAKQIADAASHGRLVLIEGAGHNDMACEFADVYARAIGDFMKTLGG